MKEGLYQEIFEYVFPFLPDDWDRIIIRGVLSILGDEIRIFIRNDFGKISDLFSLGLKSEDAIKICKNIREAFLQLRPEKIEERWNGITIIIDHEGNFQSDFDYTEDLLFNKIYDKNWASKYLQ